MEFTPIKKAELDAVLGKLPKDVIDEVNDTREARIDSKTRRKEHRISTEEYIKDRYEMGLQVEAFCYALELYGAITYADSRVLQRYMRGVKMEEVQG